MTVLFRDTFFQRHETGPHHPERPARVQAIDTRLEASGLLEQCTLGEYQPLAEDAVLTIHTANQLQRIKESVAMGGALDADTPVSPDSLQVTLATAGACCTAVDHVLSGQHPNALCLTRPPGHHATQSRSMGFCLFNNIALAAEHARANHGLTRILIVDFDVHHGNGTQDIFYADEQITFFSIHRYGYGFYPGSGAASETGSGAGLGHTLNAAIPMGTPRPEYHAQFRAMLDKAAALSKPELVLLSAGFDAHHQDPIGSLGLETEDFADLTREVIAIAQTHANGRLVSCLEGGYNLEALAESIQVHLAELLAVC